MSEPPPDPLSQLRDAQDRLLLQSISDQAIFMLDIDGTVRTWNRGAERIKGHRAEDIVGRNFSVLYTDEDREAGVPETNLESARLTGRCESEGWRLRHDGSRLWAGVNLYAIVQHGVTVGFAKVTRDLTEQRQQREALAAMTENMATALSFLPYGSCLLDRHGEIILANPAFREIVPAAKFGVRLSDAILIRELGGARTPPELHDWPWISGEEGSIGCDVVVDDVMLAARARKTPENGWVLTFEDVTARRQAERDMLQRAQLDALTGLSNRNAIDEHLARGIDECAATGGCAVLFLDLDGFKSVNDTYGHQAGDAILRDVAARILSALRPSDRTCRLGGDEFMVVPAWPVFAEQAMRVAERLREEIHRPFIIDERRISIGVSIGLAVSLAGDAGVADLTANADLALYKAKHDGRGCIRRFDSELGLAMVKRRAMELQLSQALAAQEFTLVYQPICSAEDHAIRGFEALLRWRRPDGPQISPDDFIPLAEELGLMADIGDWVLQTACRVAAGWPTHLTVAVNVSATQLRDPKLLARIEAALRSADLQPQRLEIEITETAMITDHALTLDLLRKLRALGVGIAIDDFGTGYSSLSFLRTLPFTRVKIDRSFVGDIVENPASMSIVRAVMRLGRDLGLAVTAEGVETEAQRTALMLESCDDMQGYLFAKPMMPEELPKFIRSATAA